MPSAPTPVSLAPRAAQVPPPGSPPRGRPFFQLALLAGLLLYVVAVSVVRINTPAIEPVRFPPVYVHYSIGPTAAAGAALREQALLFDSEPLFLPTTWNFASHAAHPLKISPRPVFPDFPAHVDPTGQDNPGGVFAQNSVRPEVSPLTTLQPGQWDVLGVFGQAPSLAPRLPERGAFLQVTRLDSSNDPAARPGRLVLEEIWSAAEAPKSTLNLQALWGPATFLVLFSDTGPVGEPLLVNSSGIYAVDDDLRARLDARFRHRPLPPGTYQVVIGP